MQYACCIQIYDSLLHIIGPLYQLQMGMKTWIMISDPNIAHEIFVKNSIPTSSRPYQSFAVKIYGRNNK